MTQMALSMKQTVVAKREVGAGRMNWEFAISNLWINREVLLDSIGNYIQYPVINHNRKEYRKSMYVHTHIYNWITLLCSVNQLYFNTS